jgi:Raf kinase inhibitor-like YbhB/YbcL family protein
MQVVSPVFKEGAAIPLPYSCKGQNISPPLNFVSIPEAAKSLALIMHDPDAPSGDYVHWTLWDIPADTGTLAANSVPVGAVQGINSSGENKYMGPCPPSGTHRYMFELYALDTSLSLPAETQREDLLKTMEGRVLEKATLTGTYSA